MVKEQNEGYNGSKVQINRSYISDTPTNIFIQFLEKLFPKIGVVNRKMASKFILLMYYFENYRRLCFPCSKKSTGSLPIYLNADPLFVDAAKEDYHLQQGSPCIDAGDNSAPSLPTTDIDGDARRIDDPTVADTGNGTPPIVDMGADELKPVQPEGMFYFIPNKKGGGALIYLE